MPKPILMKKTLLRFAPVFLLVNYFLFTSFKTNVETVETKTKTATENLYIGYVHGMYDAIQLADKGLTFATFEKALNGFFNLKQIGLIGEKNIITVADFDQSSIKKRLYIIDLDQKKLLLNTWVAHGKNSGWDLPDTFSNVNESNSSSLGLYVTGETYYGAHGKSMRLDGLDKGFNNNARSRAIVVHGANYVSQASINQLGRLGRSQGCPAVAPQVLDQVISSISNRTLLFINKTTPKYHSVFLNEPTDFTALGHKTLANL